MRRGRNVFNIKLKEKIRLLEDRINQLSIKQFRVGDAVYISNGREDPTKKYYLRKEYNGGSHYYFSVTMECRYSEVPRSAVSIDELSHDKPLHCKCCGKIN